MMDTNIFLKDNSQELCLMHTAVEEGFSAKNRKFLISVAMLLYDAASCIKQTLRERT